MSEKEENPATSPEAAAGLLAADAGVNVLLVPSWVPETTTIDVSWNSFEVAVLPVPQGEWAGQLALLGGTGSDRGQWDWQKSSLDLELWIPVSILPGHRHLIATLHGFRLPAVAGQAGSGVLQPSLAPVSGLLGFTWKVL